MRDIGINISSDVVYGAESFIDCVADTGFNSIFTCGNDDKFISFVSRKCSEKGLRYETLHAPFKMINGLWYEESGKEVVSILKHSVELAEDNGIGIVIVHLSSGENCPPVTDAGLRFFDELVNFAQNKNITLAVENQRKLGNISTILELYKKDSNVAFCWDVGHEKCFAHGREYMPLFGDRCITTHIHDNFQRYNIDEHLIPFDGIIDYRRTAELLNLYKYSGTLMLELDLPKADSDKYKDLTLTQFVQKAYVAINRLRIISEY
ncbi:MAG: sugar phosphate isomerase/epimerase [Clostridia bacterium]|nr:sugar phosphate isomerase/epimerase [Clostridia bacterium]